MMSLTHATIAAAGTSLILGTANPVALGLAILGSQLPDLDTTTSTIGQICYPKIVTEHLSTAVGEPETTQTLTVSFADEAAIAKLHPTPIPSADTTSPRRLTITVSSRCFAAVTRPSCLT